MTATVIQHVLGRLKDIGITDVFGVPGDYAFPVNDAICNERGMRWIGCSNELNAAYAADGYARVRGMAALCTTYGVGELSALNGIAGSYAEHVPVFHLVGAPAMAVQKARAPMHHTLGDGEFDHFRRMSEPVVCAQAVMTPQNVAYETERLIAMALFHRRPVYMAFPGDYAEQPVLGHAARATGPASHRETLAAAVDAIAEALDAAATACVLPGILAARDGRQAALQALIDRSGLPFATMFMDKSVLDEQQPAYAGIYNGRLMNEAVRAFVESRERVLAIGTLASNLNTGAFTARIDPARLIAVGHHKVRLDGRTFDHVEIGDVITALAERLRPRDWPRIAPAPAETARGSGDDPITADALYPRFAAFMRPDDIIVGETGTVSMGLAFATLPKGARFHNQPLWASIGWATPAAVGAAVASPERRLVLFTGDGSHQLTVQEIGLFGQLGLKPVIFVLNNDGYLIERLLCKDPEIAYNDIVPWRYTELPRAFGCDDWFTARVATCGELDRALAAAETAGTGVYVEVVTDAYAASPLAAQIHANLKTLYRG
jgi:indolepyruvate decarboxylase